MQNSIYKALERSASLKTRSSGGSSCLRVPNGTCSHASMMTFYLFSDRSINDSRLPNRRLSVSTEAQS